MTTYKHKFIPLILRLFNKTVSTARAICNIESGWRIIYKCRAGKNVEIGHKLFFEKAGKHNKGKLIQEASSLV
jgi:hypothetical protein